ncbi:FixH family protein [Methylocella sp.]|uniref:FixH family protein n=1 Tax=Methylocella sp. TaxID=1978226 RepID=UPI003784698B
MARQSIESEGDGRILTGRKVFLIAAASFGVVFGVNGLMAYYAVSTFSGLSEESPYEHGLGYQREIDAARVQDKRGWNVSAHVARDQASGKRAIEARFLDRDGAPVTGLAVETTLEAPADVRLDAKLAMREVEPGVYLGLADARPGQWDLVIEADRGGEQMFRTKNRVDLR